MPVNILTYADDIVILSSSWRDLQAVIDNLLLCAQSIDMACNARKTVCMVVNPQCRPRSRMVSASFPFYTGKFTIAVCFILPTSTTHYSLTNTLSDKDDIQREIISMFFVLTF